MSGGSCFEFYVSTAAAAAIETIGIAIPTSRIAVLIFHPANQPDRHMVFSNAEAEQLAPVLRAMLGRLESGALVRLPPTDGLRWLDVDVPGRG
jgi:hypothetical protein